MKKIIPILLILLSSCAFYRTVEVKKADFVVEYTAIEKRYNQGYDYNILVVYWRECGILGNVLYRQEYPVTDTVIYKKDYIEQKDIIK